MKCPKCQTENRDDARFCADCGARLVLVCSQCGSELPAAARFCDACGAQVGAQPAGVPERPATPALDKAIQRLVPREYAERLRHFAAGERLPDLFTVDLGLPAAASPRERLIALGQRHRRQTRAIVNWVGTYENVIRSLLRSWELEGQWNRSLHRTYLTCTASH